MSVLSVLITLSLKCKHNWDELEEAPLVHEVWQFCLSYITHYVSLSYILFIFPFQHGKWPLFTKGLNIYCERLQMIVSYLRTNQMQQYNLPTLNDPCSESMFYSCSKLLHKLISIFSIQCLTHHVLNNNTSKCHSQVAKMVIVNSL